MEKLMIGLRAVWTVTAGVIPGIVEPQHTKQWLYTGEHYDQDAANAEDGKPENNFTRMMKEAHEYAMRKMNPLYLNWVRVDFMWV